MKKIFSMLVVSALIFAVCALTVQQVLAAPPAPTIPPAQCQPFGNAHCFVDPGPYGWAAMLASQLGSEYSLTGNVVSFKNLKGQYTVFTATHETATVNVNGKALTAGRNDLSVSISGELKLTLGQTTYYFNEASGSWVAQ